MVSANIKLEIVDFIQKLDEERGFFNSVDEINKFNIDAIIELIQYQNVKEQGDPLFTRREIRQGIKKYFIQNQPQSRSQGE
ncbi:hypothetical protein [Alkaliphilus serpentinus]|uniref:Uncharacterized protein n=1 Tax=Alkaliphilus serpentinus TaxID=1482731 RepID=A0A833HP30_9FIRM|nr:hypothetical protein [Alkaliphilus serpentinus]KAB3530267.1 hypothetical protein F8153_07570 [Alkaliphilus serpentinus]